MSCLFKREHEPDDGLDEEGQPFKEGCLRLFHVIAQMRLIFGNSGVGGEAAFGAQNVIKAAECEASRIITQPRPRRGLALRRLSPPIVSRHVAKFALSSRPGGLQS